MRKNFLLNIILIITLLQNNLILTEIVFVFEQFRNGIYKYIPLGLTKESQKQHLALIDKEISSPSMRAFYLLGLYIKEKYKNIINPKIN